jgi:YidC/Oxa1 family membrane protein insertase
MEQNRVLLAVILSFVVLLSWNYFFVDKTQSPPQDKAIEKIQQPVEKNKPEENTISASAEHKEIQSSEAVVVPVPVVSPQENRIITIESGLFTATITDANAAITSYTLKRYRELASKDSPLKQLIPNGNKNQEYITRVEGVSLNNENSPWKVINFAADKLNVQDQKQSISFQKVVSSGITIIKTFTFEPSSYLIGMEVTIKNDTTEAMSPAVQVGISKEIGKEDNYGFVGPSMNIDNHLEQIKKKKINEKDRYEGKIEWVGVQDRYFISSLIPKGQEKGSIHFKFENDLLQTVYESQPAKIDPQKENTLHFDIFMGPMSMKVLGNFDNGLSKAIHFGMFDILAKPCLWLMNFIHDHIIHNYGVAIIILTLLIKIIFWPLGNKSYKSMNQMKRLQPEMQKLREKFKDDKRKMNEELMQLYKTYKVNPMGGCLPMVVQIPVFFALYRMLYQAIELRHAPFFGWINDLSAPDRLFHFSFSIPLMEPPYGIPVLTLIMGASMFLQQRMSPPVGDPAQAKMMMFMPVFFTFIFINFSSGLVLYWLVNNVVSIGQQYFIQKKNL